MATKKVYTNTLAQIAGKASTAFISIFLIKALTNYLDLADYGLYSKIYNFLSVFAVIADLGLYTITIREISDHKGNSKMVEKIVGNVLSIRTGLGAFIILLALASATLLSGYDSPKALWGIAIAGFFTLFGLINSSVMSLLQAYLKTEFSFISTTVGKIVNFLAVLLVIFVLFPKDSLMSADQQFLAFQAIMLAGLAGNVAMTAIIYAYARKVERIRFHWDWDYVKHLLSITLPYGLALFLNVIFFKVDVVLLSVLEPRETADIAIALYAVPMKIVEVGMMFGTLFLNSMLPLFTASIRDKKPEELSHLVDRAFKILFLGGTAIFAFIVANGEGVIKLLSSAKYLEKTALPYTSLEAMYVVAGIFLLFFLSSLFTYLLIANNAQQRLLSINAKIALFNGIGNVALIPVFSFMGSAWVTLGSQVLLLLYTKRESDRISKYQLFSPFVAKTAGIATVSG